MATQKAPAGVSALLAQPALARVLDVLDGAGEEARLVGGAVRNALLDRPVHEFDIATTATPDVVMARAKAAKLRTIPTGIAHGTVTVMAAGQGFEVTSLREDVETDGRRAKVRFGRDFTRDAQRRDFTMNALSLSRDGTLHDPIGGLADIAARRVRFIGNPAQRIAEDYLRILRFFRFSADYGAGALDAAGVLASIRGRAGLVRLSRERVRSEILKLLGASRAASVVAEMSGAGLLGPLLGCVPNPARLARHIVCDDAPDAVLRLAALAVCIPEDAGRLREALRLSNSEYTRLAGMAAALLPLHGRLSPPNAGTLRRLLFEQGRESLRDALALARAEAAGAGDWAPAFAFVRDTPEPRLPFSGADLKARGLVMGPAIGRALKDLQARWIRAGFPQDPHVLAQMLDEVAASA